MNSDIETEFAMDDGDLCRSVQDLLSASSVSPYIEISSRAGMTGRGVVTSFKVKPPLPPEAWSHGEQLLWQFCLSIAGKGSFSLGYLSSYFRHSELFPHVADVLGTALGVGEGK